MRKASGLLDEEDVGETLLMIGGAKAPQMLSMHAAAAVVRSAFNATIMTPYKNKLSGSHVTVEFFHLHPSFLGRVGTKR